MNTDLLRPWPRVKWDHYDLSKLSEALMVMNPSGFTDAESQASYIRNLAEAELYRHQKPIDISTGGWSVFFFRAWPHLADRFDYVALCALSPHVAWEFACKPAGVEV